jgi:hypothetical protein
VRPSREELLGREERWALPVALATLAAIGLLIAAAIVVRVVSGDGEAEILREAYEHSSAITLSSILQAAAFALLAAPLLYLFRAVEGRSPQVRRQLVGLIVAAPLFLAVASVFNGVATNDAATDFVAGRGVADLTLEEAFDDCRGELEDSDFASMRDEYGLDGKGGDPEAEVTRSCAATQVADDRATNAVSEAPTRALATGFSLGGRLGLAFALIYCCLHAMRAGLLSRFWGSLGMALGAGVLLLLVQFTLIWFLYFALLVAGWIPGGRPPAWAAGRAIPWPTPGEKASAELETESAAEQKTGADQAADTGDTTGAGEKKPSADPEDRERSAESGHPGEDPPRKRKQRD